MAQEVPDFFDRTKLAPFLKTNPEAEYQRDKNSVTIAHPWGDDTLSLNIGEDAEDLVSALNSVYLPPRFAAIWHKDTHDLEVIGGPIPATDDVHSRSFLFDFEGQPVRCGWDEPSERLIQIANSAEFELSVSVRADSVRTSYRNLRTVQAYLRTVEETPEAFESINLQLRSFWIRAINWDENRVVELAQHLNFYMYYFDRSTPRINILEPSPKKEKQETPERYPFGSFPSEFTGYSLDPYLLGLWESSTRGNVRLRYLYSYQVLEYAAFYYVKEDILQTIKRAIVAPETRSNPDVAVERILDAVSEDRLHDDARMKAVVKQVVDPEILWKEIEPNRDYFCQPVHFDGGLKLEPLLRPSWDLEDFASSWDPKFIDHIRKLRNALVHGREQRMFNVIAPTEANNDRIRPWLAPLSIVAMQTILYRTL